jgi:6-phosphogluconolactonase
MPDVVYVGLQDGDKIVRFGIYAGAGKLVPGGETPAAGAPSVFAVSPNRRVLYVGYRGTPAIESCRIDSASGALTLLGRVHHTRRPISPRTAPASTSSAYYQGAHAAAIAGPVRGPAVDRQNTAPGAHAILTDPSNRFAFVPHIARQNDNVLEPPKNIPGPNFIAQFRFDAATGRLSPNAPFKLDPPGPIGPRHYCFHPTPISIRRQAHHRLPPRSRGNPVRHDPVAAWASPRNTCSQIYLTPWRGSSTSANGNTTASPASRSTRHRWPTPAGHAPTEAVPSAFGLDSTGGFLFSAGTASGRLASYRVNGETGALTPLDVYTVGQRPAAALAVPLGG